MKKEFCLKTDGRKSKMKTSGASYKMALRNLTGFARIAMMAG